MTDPNKTVFISYRRSVSRDRALLIFNHLRQYGYDVFLDVKTIDSGAFDSVILNQIGARTHFVVLIANGALERCQNEGDWLRREIEEALKLGRNIVPVIDEGLDFDKEIGYLPSSWRDQFKRINSLPWVHYYFDSALRDLMERFLNPPDFPVKIN
ncbi:MAG TPA: toll/interleukin-1 receptor domain-containing protein, partial [Aggregatilineales bacterium]|nr:toll/interleukin-1 receptor domain-containing protein [Aggregatilineales bacterium]